MKKTLIVLILISLFASLAINPQQIKADDNSVNAIVAMKNAYDSALSLNENNKVDSSYKLLTNDTSSYYLYFADTIYQQIHEDNIVKLSNESNAYNNAEVAYEIQGDTLHINGSGPIDDFSGSNKAPWYEYRDTITNVVIDEGVTSIGDQAFISFTNLDYLVLPNTITSIGEGAFYECSNLKTVILPNSLTTILEGAFCDCSCLRYITIPSSVNYIGEEALLDCNPNLIVYIHDNDYAKQYCIDNDLSYVEVDYSSFVLDKISITVPNKLDYEYNEELDLTGLEVYGVYSNGNYSIPIRINDGYTVSNYNKQQAGQQKITVTYKTFNAYFNVNVSRGNIIQSGTCGNQINFYLYEGGVLRIEGNGLMDNYTELTNPNKAPWYEYRDSIYYVEVAYGVTSIGTWAFKDCSSLSTITILDSVKSIRDSAFVGCSSLTSITIPDSATSIGSNAFYGCTSLTSLTMPISVRFASDSFTNVSNLKEVRLTKGTGKGANYIDPNYRYTPWYISRNNLTSLVLDDGIISIGDSTFVGCSSLTSITIPDSVTSIGYGAFGGCSSLTSITISDSVTSIGKSTFEGCSSLTSITIPDSVTSIGGSAFEGCSSLTSITIPSSVTSIGSEAFGGCSSLTSITIPDSVTSIGSYTFRECSSLTSITIPDSVTSIGNYAFQLCSSLSSITIPDSVTSIGNYAFNGCSSLTSITIPDSVTSIGDSAFLYCTSLTSITIPDSVTSIGDSTFLYCTSLTSITIPDSVTSIGSEAFGGCSSLTSITIPDSVTSIAGAAFSGCSSLTSITIPDSVTSIGRSAFGGCSSLTSITISDSVTSIADRTFYDCTSLTSITIPDSVKSIRDSAFYHCSSLTSLTMPISASIAFSSSFTNVSNLKEVRLTKGTGKGVDYTNYTHSYTPWYNSRNKLTSLVLDDGITSIGNYAFQGCSSLTSITIPDSVTSIGSYAFNRCSSLTSITIPDSVTSIGNYAFGSCSSLTSINIPDSVTSIADRTFSGCSSLTSITIPDSVTSIGSDAFYGCSNNLKIYGYHNDYLKQYCEDNNLTYVALYKISNKTLNGTLLQNGTIRLNLSVDIDEDVSLDNAYALINGNKVKLERNDQGKVIVHTSGLAPKNINDDITIRYYDENDNPISSNIELNVRDYIETLLSGYLNKKTKAFYKSLLNYGAYAQELFEHNTDNLANSTLEDIDKDLSDVTYDKVSTYTPNIVGSTEGISAYGQSLVLKDEVDFRVYFLLDGSHSIDEYTFTDGETKLNPIKQSNNIFYVTISKNAAPDLDKNHTISVNLNNAGDLKVSTSVLAYCEMTLRKDPVSQEDIKLANFVKAIYKYSLAAKNLLGE